MQMSFFVLLHNTVSIRGVTDLRRNLALKGCKVSGVVCGDVGQPSIFPGTHLRTVILHGHALIRPVFGLRVHGEALQRLRARDGNIGARVVYKDLIRPAEVINIVYIGLQLLKHSFSATQTLSLGAPAQVLASGSVLPLHAASSGL